MKQKINVQCKKAQIKILSFENTDKIDKILAYLLIIYIENTILK